MCSIRSSWAGVRSSVSMSRQTPLNRSTASVRSSEPAGGAPACGGGAARSTGAVAGSTSASVPASVPASRSVSRWVSRCRSPHTRALRASSRRWWARSTRSTTSGAPPDSRHSATPSRGHADGPQTREKACLSQPVGPVPAVAVAVVDAVGPEQADAVVVPQRLGGHADRIGQLADGQPCACALHGGDGRTLPRGKVQPAPPIS